MHRSKKNYVELQKFMAIKRGSLNPAKYLNETFELYSIPAFDKGAPEVVSGSDIGSSKKLIENDDVLLSRIVPHIRRAWVIQSTSSNKKIGSGEWIVFNSSDINSNYLKYFFETGQFNSQFLMNLTGVGGSLMRANIKLTGKIKIPLPSLPIQNKIAEILNAANDYRQKTKDLIDKYEDLAQSLFSDMFGDPVRNNKNWDILPFEEMISFDTKMTKDFDKYGDMLHIGIRNIEKGTGKILDCISVKEEGLTSGKYLFDSRHIIYSKIRPNLNKVALPDFEGLCSADSYPLLPIEGTSNRLFIAFLLRSESFVDFILQHSTRTNIPKANRKQMKLYKGISPPITIQNQFAERIKVIESQKNQAQAALDKAEDLFQSLLQRAFKGELVK